MYVVYNSKCTILAKESLLLYITNIIINNNISGSLITFFYIKFSNRVLLLTNEFHSLILSALQSTTKGYEL